jgi:hypothetical protein
MQSRSPNAGRKGSSMFHARIFSAVLAAGLLLPGCLFISTTELRVAFSESGAAVVTMTFTDIRSDAATDSMRLRDYGIMMASLGGDGLKEIERRQHLSLTGHRFIVSGDSLLNAELSYYVYSAEDVEGLRFADNQISVAVSQEREIVSTDGTVKIAGPRMHIITWPGDTREITYCIREKNLPRSVSLASLYNTYGEPADTTAPAGK